MDDPLIPIVSLKRVGLSACNKRSRVNQEPIIDSYCTHEEDQGNYENNVWIMSENFVVKLISWLSLLNVCLGEANDSILVLIQLWFIAT